MKSKVITFKYYNPNLTFDGTPYKAAGLAAGQTLNVIKLLEMAVSDTEIQAKNSFMQRQIDIDGPPEAIKWYGSPEDKAINSIKESINGLNRKIKALKLSISFDPNEELD